MLGEDESSWLSTLPSKLGEHLAEMLIFKGDYSNEMKESKLIPL